MSDPHTSQKPSMAAALGRAALAAGLFALLLALLGAAFAALADQGLRGPALQLGRAALTAAVFAGLVAALCRFIDRRALSSLGLTPLASAWKPFLAGAGFWLGLAAVGVATGLLIGAFELRFTPPTLALAGVLLLQILVVFLYEALPEEMVFRGYILDNLIEGWGLFTGVAVQAVLFMLAAFGVVMLAGLMGMPTDWAIGLDRVILFLSFGTTLALLRLWTGSLWTAIGFHTAFQVVSQLLFQGRLVGVSPESGADVEMMVIFMWLFAIVIGGVIALTGLFMDKRRRETGWRKPPKIGPREDNQAT
jgi:membrane protease YdiL (CAAX protease family)